MNTINLYRKANCTKSYAPDSTQNRDSPPFGTKVSWTYAKFCCEVNVFISKWYLDENIFAILSRLGFKTF